MNINRIIKRNFFVDLLPAGLIITLLFLPLSTNAQGGNKTFGVYPTLGIGIGVFSPGDVNAYINDHLPSNILSTYGTYDLYMYEAVNAGVTARIKWIDITAFMEYALGPKWIIISGGTNQFYNFNRISPGLLVNFYIPMGSGRHAVYLGGGSQFHFMHFEEYSASAIGFRFNVGYSLQFKGINIQPHIAFNLANAEDTKTYMYQPFELKYTGGQIGVNLSFHKPVYCK